MSMSQVGEAAAGSSVELTGVTRPVDRREALSTDGLRSDQLTLIDTIAQSVTVMAPAMSGGFITYLAAIKAGGATPLAFLLATGACLLIGGVVSNFAVELRSAGSLYTYAVAGLGSFWGYITGWTYGMGLWLAGPAVLAGSGSFMSLFMTGIGAPTFFQHWWLWFGIGLIGWFVLGYHDVRISTRVFLVFTGIGITVLLLLAIIVIAKGGAHGNTLKAFSPGAAHVSWTGIFGGVAFGLLSFTGFETAASLAEETKRPRRAIPAAVIGAVVLGGAFYVIVTYATSIGYGVREATTAWPASVSGLAPLTSKYAHWLTNIVYLVVAIDAFLCGLGLANVVTRTMFAMGRDRVLPGIFARTHPRHKSPYVALIAYVILSVLFPVILIVFTSTTTIEAITGTKGSLANGLYVFAEGLEIIPPAIMLGYVLLCVAGIAKGARDSRPSMILLSLGGVIAAGIAVYGSLYFSFTAPTPGASVPTPFAIIPWLVLGWLVIGALVAIWLRRSRPASWAGMGTVFEPGG
jgi:amino acid transporter